MTMLSALAKLAHFLCFFISRKKQVSKYCQLKLVKYSSEQMTVKLLQEMIEFVTLVSTQAGEVASNSSTVVEHSLYHPKVEGSNLASAAGTRIENGNMVQTGYPDYRGGLVYSWSPR